MTELEADGLLRGTLPAKEQFKLVRGFTEMAEAVKGAAHVQVTEPESICVKNFIQSEVGLGLGPDIYYIGNIRPYNIFSSRGGSRSRGGGTQ